MSYPVSCFLRQQVGNVNQLQHIEEAVTLIRKLDEQIESMKNRHVSNKRIRIVEGALDMAYTSLDALQGGASDDSYDDSFHSLGNQYSEDEE